MIYREDVSGKSVKTHTVEEKSLVVQDQPRKQDLKIVYSGNNTGKVVQIRWKSVVVCCICLEPNIQEM